MRSIFQNRAVLHKAFFLENFSPVCDSLVRANIDIQNTGKKRISFYGWKSKNVKKTGKCVRDTDTL